MWREWFAIAVIAWGAVTAEVLPVVVVLEVVLASCTKEGGRSVTWSPWDIQTRVWVGILARRGEGVLCG